MASIFLWLAIIMLAYFFFSLSFFGDKLVLGGKSHAALYTFYIGVLSLLIIVCIPFIKFGLPDVGSIIWIVLDGVAYILGAYTLFLALEKFEVSRVTPAIGAVQPPMILLLSWILWGAVAITGMNILALILLLAGSVLISVEKSWSLPKNMSYWYCFPLYFFLWITYFPN